MEYPTPSSMNAPFPARTNRFRPATPIEIPTRQGRNRSPLPSSPIMRPMSPELIFEMSPLATEFPGSSHYSHHLPTADDDEPFLYPFPQFPRLYSAKDIHSSARTKTFSDMFSQELSTKPQRWPQFPVYPRGRVRSKRDDTTFSSLSNLPGYTSKVTHKITGFAPLASEKPTKEPHTLKQRPSRLHLSPPPSRPSYSPSAWTLPGSCDTTLDDTSTCLSVDDSSSALEFDQYLIQRIEGQRYVCLREAPPFASMQATIRG